ncbi:MAG: IS3 family transposase [Gammaproteobacteria bacterium]|nr:IS3 family transposase [Gammaproteobacteria bacterium]
MTRRRYAPEYRRQMVELARTGRTAEELSREFECSAQAIRNWVRQADLDEGRRADGLTTAERDELRRLRRENLQLREEREILKKAGGRVRAGDRHGAREIFALVKANLADHRVATMCRVLGVSSSGYYAWLRCGRSARSRRDGELSARIAAIHRDSRGTYGVPRVHAELAEAGERVARKRVARLMRAHGLRGVSRRKWTRTTLRDGAETPVPDLVERDFTASRPNALWVADATYIPTWEGFLFLAVVIDVYSRRVVGWSMGSRLVTALMLDALDMALAQRDARDVIHHSDHGAQYTSIAFGQRCREAGVTLSMGSVGDCYDNALCESFFATLECELIERSVFRTRDEARLAVFDFVEAFYNRRRRHSALGYLSPVAFERAAQAAAA